MTEMNAWDLQLKCASVLHETLIVLVFMYGSDIMLQKEEWQSRIRAVQIDNFRDLLGIRRMDSPKCMDKGWTKGLMKVF